MYHNDNDGNRPERPRAKPEIIPPDRSGAKDASPLWVAFDQRGGTHRVFIARPGPFSIIASLLIAGVVLAAILLVLLGVVLFWIPAVLFIIAAFMLSGTIRYYWQRLQHWGSPR